MTTNVAHVIDRLTVLIRRNDMTRFLALSLAWSLLTSLAAGGPTEPQKTTHPRLSEDTIIRVGGAGKTFQNLLTIAQQNRIPLGVVVGPGRSEAICERSLSLEPGDRKVSDLIAAVRSSTPGYEAQIASGVLEIRPEKLQVGVSTFLDLHITRFESHPKPHVGLGSSLWMAIRGVIAPGKGTDTETLVSLDAEKVPGLTLTDQSVHSILDTIASAGSGGIWVLHAAKLTVLSDMTPVPYEIHGYVGEGDLNSLIACSTQ